MSGPLVLTEDAFLHCDHRGKLDNKPSQDLLTIAGRRVLVARDPEGRHIHMCPNISPSTKPCITSLVVEQGYSSFVSVNGAAVCLDTIKGHTDGTPQGAVYYTVKDPGQPFVVADQ
jgi:hypothetical protein